MYNVRHNCCLITNPLIRCCSYSFFKYINTLYYICKNYSKGLKILNTSLINLIIKKIMSNDQYIANKQAIENLEEEIVVYIKSRSVKNILGEIFLMNTVVDDILTPGNSALGQVFLKEEDLGHYVANILQSYDNNSILETLKTLRTEIGANNIIVMNLIKTTFILDLLASLLTKYDEQINIYIL
jgi:hypothetical protein